MMQTTISILGADIYSTKGVWRTTDITLVQDTLPIDSFRVAAGAALAHQHPQARVLVQGGLAGWGDPTRPSIASVMKEELIALGVDAQRIDLDEMSAKTYQQLVCLQTYAEQKNVSLIYILTNEWHVPRVAAFLQHPTLAGLRAKNPTIMAAESVLMGVAPAVWKDPIARAHNHPAMQAIRDAEAGGVEDITHGTYRFV